MVMLTLLLTLTGISMQESVQAGFLVVRVMLLLPLTKPTTQWGDEWGRIGQRHGLCRGKCITSQYVGVGTVLSDFPRVCYTKNGNLVTVSILCCSSDTMR